MKILQLSKYYPPRKGGIELVAKMITKAHSHIGDTVSIIAFSNQNKKFTGQFGESVNEIMQDLFLLSTPISLNLSRRFEKIVEEEKPEKIYVHLPNPYMHHLICQHKKMLYKKSVKISGVYHSDIVNQKRLGKIYDQIFLKSSSIYDEIICTSENLKQTSPILSRIPEQKIKIIPLCTDIQIPFRKRTEFNGNLIAVGRMVPYKGFEFLVKTISKTSWNLTIVGDGPEYKKLKSLAGPNILLPGNLNDQEKNELLNDSDLYIMSSINRAEAFGLVILEAFQAGMPVIASQINTGVTFLVEDNVRGKTFPALNEDALISSINYFQTNAEKISEFSTNCRAFYDNSLTFEHFKRKISELDHR